jgi:hypothetical protein
MPHMKDTDEYGWPLTATERLMDANARRPLPPPTAEANAHFARMCRLLEKHGSVEKMIDAMENGEYE